VVARRLPEWRSGVTFRGFDEAVRRSASALGSGLRPAACPGMTAAVRALPSFRGFATAKSPEPRTDAGGRQRAAIPAPLSKSTSVLGSGLRPAACPGMTVGFQGAPSFRGFAIAKSPEPRTDTGDHKRAAIAAPLSESTTVLGSGLRPSACPGMTVVVQALRLSGASRSEEPGTQNRCGISSARRESRAYSQRPSVLGSGLRPAACPGMTVVVRGIGAAALRPLARLRRAG